MWAPSQWLKRACLESYSRTIIVCGRAWQVDAGGARRHGAAAAAEWATAAGKLARELLVKHGLDVAGVDIALHVRPCEGLVRQLDGSVEKRFSKAALLYPIQVPPPSGPAACFGALGQLPPLVSSL